MARLTARQQQIFNLICRTIEKTGFPPTRAEIAGEFGFKSINAAEEHLQALARKGVIELVPGISRGIRLAKNPGKDAASSREEPKFYSVPMVVRLTAGRPILSKAHIGKVIRLDPLLFLEKPDFLVKVEGDSMQDAGFKEGDILAVKKTDAPEDGSPVVARSGTSFMVRRCRKNDSGTELISENPETPAVRPDAADPAAVRVEGVAVCCLRAKL